MRTKEILDLALQRGEITSGDVVRELVGETKSSREYRNLLAQASTLLARLHAKGVLARGWSRANRGQYVYSPSEETIDSLLPVLGVLEERKRRREIEDSLLAFTRRIILELRMENEIKAALHDCSTAQEGGPEPLHRVWVVATGLEAIRGIGKEVDAIDDSVEFAFLLPDELPSSGMVGSAKILYGWDYVASSRRKTVASD